MSVRLIVSYQGTAYAGWQFQDNAVTVQAVVEQALGALLGEPVRVVGASRTDAGVHARGQAVHVQPPAAALRYGPRALVHGTNHRLPGDVRLLAAHRMPDGFHARRAANGKEYSYRLSRRSVVSPLDAPYVARVPRRLDVARMQAAAALLPGRHDFSAFAAAGGSHAQPFRTVTSAVLEPAGEAGDEMELRFRIRADGFLRGMVRALVGTLLEVGQGRRSPEDFQALLAGAGRPAAGPTAPAHGLVLERVFYPPAWDPLE